ncbi:hypothetical protein ASG93_20355 [Paenibacillus sp. Soil787]|nr:hypothetical protein ASG93_20355 [Paenibacillus sp. Soil787]
MVSIFILYLITIILNTTGTPNKGRKAGADWEALCGTIVKSAQIFIGTLPILLVYPFLQKFFIKGIVVGV